MCVSGHASSSSHGSAPRRCARCSCQRKNNAIARKTPRPKRRTRWYLAPSLPDAASRDSPCPGQLQGGCHMRVPQHALSPQTRRKRCDEGGIKRKFCTSSGTERERRECGVRRRRHDACSNPRADSSLRLGEQTEPINDDARAFPHAGAQRGNVHLPDASRGSPGRAGRLPEVRNGARARRRRPAPQARVDVPDAPRDRARRAGHLPDLRHGARAEHASRPRSANPELRDMTRRFWCRRRAHGCRCSSSRCGDAARAAARARSMPRAALLDPARAGDAGRALGRLAVLRARLGSRS